MGEGALLVLISKMLATPIEVSQFAGVERALAREIFYFPIDRIFALILRQERKVLQHISGE
jgi:hypothetical protein